MITRRPTEFIVTKDTELTVPAQTYYMMLKRKYGSSFTARITDIIQMLAVLYDVKEFELFDPRTWNSGLFASYLLDNQMKFMSGEPLDMVVFHEDLLKNYNWTIAEKRRFINETIEEKIWAIFKFVIDPTLTYDILL